MKAGCMVRAGRESRTFMGKQNHLASSVIQLPETAKSMLKECSGVSWSLGTVICTCANLFNYSELFFTSLIRKY